MTLDPETIIHQDDQKPSNVTMLPVKPKPKLGDESDRFLVVESRGCQHRNGFRLNDKEDCVICRDCGAKLNPMYALKMLANQETRWHEARSRYQDEMKRLDERCRTTCEHCGKMTKISR